MSLHEIKKARMSLWYDWERYTFDALVFPLKELELPPKEENSYIRMAKIDAERIVWDTYNTVRESFMQQVDHLLRPYKDRMDNEKEESLKRRMYVCFMEGRIRLFENREKLEHAQLLPIQVGENDFHNTEMASLFAHLPLQPEIAAWLKELDVSWDYDQLHMVTWFSGQLSLGSGKYSRSRPNHSAKVTYERLVNPFSLLWIAAALGEERDVVAQARHEMEEYKSWRAKCGVVRRAIPWNRIYTLALNMAESEAQMKGSASKEE